MRIRALLILFPALLTFLIVSCKTETTKPKPVEKPYALLQVQQNSDLNIHIRHFTTEKCKQGVSKWVYAQLPDDVKENFKEEETFVKHHTAEEIKAGLCDNTVEIYDEKTGTIFFRCGGHTQNVR